MIIFFIIGLIVLTLVLYLAAGIVSGDWTHSGGTWLRFIVVALAAVLLIPAIQIAVHWVQADDLALMFAFVVIMLLVYALIVPELSVSDEWMTTIFTSFLTVVILYVIERVLAALFNTQLFTFL